MSDNNTCVIVAWHNRDQIDDFCKHWGIEKPTGDQFTTFDKDDYAVMFVRDIEKAGCARTKNAGVTRAVQLGFQTVIIIDDDCYPTEEVPNMEMFVRLHVEKLNEEMELPWFRKVTEPQSRGTPYEISRPCKVAAVMGFWEGVGDYDACHQLVYGAKHPMEFKKDAAFNEYFPLSGMNICFRPAEWHPWCQFIDVPRWDDIWMGFLWQKEAYRRGCCFRLDGPIVRHSRQSNVFQNLLDESKYMARNETLWHDIATAPTFDYNELRKLLPV